MLSSLSMTAGLEARAAGGGSHGGDASAPQAAQIDESKLPPNTSPVDKAVIARFPHLLDHSRIAPKCLNCHQAQYRDISASIHGKAGLLKGFPEGTLCLTCHESNHIVRDPLKVQNFQLDPLANVPRDIACTRCHGDATIAAAFQFPPHVPSEFERSIHYRKAMLGDKGAPVCFDCHGAHSIVRVDNPSSPVHEAQKVKVCAKCHAGANATFAASFDHTPIAMDTKPLEFWTITIFKVLTLGTFMALGLYILLDIISILRQFLMPRRFKPHHHHPAKTEKPEYVERFNVQLRIQHFLLLTSVIGCVVTAWPLTAPESQIARNMMDALGGAARVAIIHRVFGFLMIGDFIYHIVYLYFRFRAGGRWHPMIPMPKDAFDLWHQMLFFFGLRDTKPEFEEYAFHEKFDYWAVFWGVAMIGVSGVIMTFPTWVSHILPAQAITLSNIIHADEALLAAMVLFIWHFYNVHLKPGIFPMNWAWLTGRIKKEIYEEEHMAHVKKLKKEGKWKD